MFKKNYSFIRQCAIVIALTAISTACTVQASEQQPPEAIEMSKALQSLIRREPSYSDPAQQAGFYLNCLGVPSPLAIEFTDFPAYRKQMPTRISMIRGYLNSLEENPDTLNTDYGLSYTATNIRDALARLDEIENFMELKSSAQSISLALSQRMYKTQSVASKPAEPTTAETHRLATERAEAEDARRIALEQERQRQLALEMERQERAVAFEAERQRLMIAEAEAARVQQLEAMRLSLEKEDNDRAQNVAATSMQKLHRGHQARKQAKALRAAKKEASRTAAATKIQKTVRKHNAQKKMQNAARKIQKVGRGFLGRKRAKKMRALRDEAEHEAALVSSTEAASSSDSDMPPVAPFAGSSVPTLSMPGRSMMAAGGGYATELGATGEVDTSGDADRLARIEAVRLHRHDAAGAGLAPRLQIIVDNLRKATFNKMMVNRRLMADGVTDPAEKTAVFNALGIKE